jgi:DMSO/TMAO reductase YedYZ molybdopterin-dependent catalytic subunit
MTASVDRRTLMRLAAAGLASALAPLGGCARPFGQPRGTTHQPTPDAPMTPVDAWYSMSITGAYEADLASYRLKINGAVDDSLELSIAALREGFEQLVAPITLACVGNSPGGDLMSSGMFRGVRVRDVLRRAGVDERASGAIVTGLDGFASYQSMEDLMRSESVFALDLGTTTEDLAPLPVERGFPCRIMTPGLYGYMQPKWIDTVEVVEHGGSQRVIARSIPYFEGKMQLASGFSSPRSGSAGEGLGDILGYAFGDGRLITRVEVSIDDGAWQPAEIVFDEHGTARRNYLWVLWRYPWTATPGQHVLRCRATYEDGSTQLEGTRFPYSGGSITEITVSVEAGA